MYLVVVRREKKKLKSVKETCKGGKGGGSLCFLLYYKPSLFTTCYCCTKYKEEHLMREDISIGYVLVYLVLYFILFFIFFYLIHSIILKEKERER